MSTDKCYQLRFRMRAILVAIALSATASAYFGSYYRLSRRGMQEASVYDMPGFLYVPFDDAARTEDLARHHQLASFYAPANWIDRQFFGGEWPIKSIVWRLAD